MCMHTQVCWVPEAARGECQISKAEVAVAVSHLLWLLGAELMFLEVHLVFLTATVHRTSPRLACSTLCLQTTSPCMCLLLYHLPVTDGQSGSLDVCPSWAHCSSFLCDPHFPSTELFFSLEFSPFLIYPLQSFRKLQSLLSGGEGGCKGSLPTKASVPQDK